MNFLSLRGRQSLTRQSIFKTTNEHECTRIFYLCRYYSRLLLSIRGENTNGLRPPTPWVRWTSNCASNDNKELCFG